MWNLIILRWEAKIFVHLLSTLVKANKAMEAIYLHSVYKDSCYKEMREAKLNSF